MNNLGVAQLSRSATSQTGLPTYYFNKAVDEDPDDADYLFNLGYAYWQDHDPGGDLLAARSRAAQPVRCGCSFCPQRRATEAATTWPRATRERELARRLSAAYASATGEQGSE